MRKSIYLERYAWKGSLFPDFIPDKDLELIVVIPVYKEHNLLQALASLNRCDKPTGNVLIIVLINESEIEHEETRKINQTCESELKDYNSRFELLYSYQQLPAKKAGVGLARKIGMDEAVRIFEGQNRDGVIVCFDADCICQKNYLIEIEKHFLNKKTKAGIVFYEHLLKGQNHTAILNYELYLRYYIDAIRYTGFPFGHQTLGSCIVVISSTYQAEGGMNTRKAGEDFYFLNKIIPLGGFVEINETTIYPSDRVSDRVPFGTGKAVQQLLDTSNTYEVYHPNSFEDLKQLFVKVRNFWDDDLQSIPVTVHSFFDGNFQIEIEKIKNQTTSLENFTQRFYLWFDAFRILKFVHFARDNFYPNIPLEGALQWLASVQLIELPIAQEDQLNALRSYDRRNLDKVK